MTVPFLACMAATAAFYALPPRVLPSIHVVEGGVPGSVHRNTDGSEDLGVMQINTLWIAPIARVTRMAAPAVRARLIADPCFNIAASGAVMRTYLHESRGDLMMAVGYYHSHTPVLGRDYLERVTGAARALFGGGSARDASGQGTRAPSLARTIAMSHHPNVYVSAAEASP